MDKQSELEKLTYSQMRDLLENQNDAQALGYISENLAILRGNPFELLSHMPDIPPFRFDEMRLVLVKKGEVHPIINLRQYNIRAGDLTFVSGGSIVQLTDTHQNVMARAMSCTNELLALTFDGRLPTILKRLRLAFVVHLSPTEQLFVETLHKLLWQAVHDKEMSPQVVMGLVNTIITYIDHLYTFSEKKHTATQSHEEMIFDQFVDLVNQYGAREHQLAFYADKVCLSQRYLGTIISKVSGRTSKEWIDDAIIMEAKVLLKHTDMLVNQIAEKLNFNNYSFFSRYFRRLTGMSPQEFRES